MDRETILSSLKQNQEISVLIIGAGINGVATFRDLALNDVDVLLIDRGDFCSGTSAASSHMAHGGLRYLENGEFRLVREAVKERNRMIENAPHLVKPLPTVIPIFKFWSGLLNAPLKFAGLLDKPSERGALVIKLGLILYDAFTKAQGTVPPHCFEDRETSLSKYPNLNPNIRYTATYYDGAILSPERYTIELLLDAESEGAHARSLNYVSFIGLEDDTATLQDNFSGEFITVNPKIIINAAGPWIDFVNGDLGLNTKFIGGTKGSHLVLDHPDLRAAINDKEFFFENRDGRIVEIFPLYDKVMIGTSDIPIDDPDNALCTEEEINYFFEMIARVFPTIKLNREQIVYHFSGVRPLENSVAKTTGQITRDHSIKEDDVGNIPIYSLVGGKWTSYRAFSEQTTDKVLSYLGRQRLADTKQLPVGGGRNFLKVKNSLNGSEMLFARYGSRCIEINAYSKGEDSYLKHYPGMKHRELAFLISKEKVVHLDDLILRRTLLAHLGQLTRPLLDEIADISSDLLDWNPAQKNREIQRALEILKEKHGVEIV